MAEAIMSDAQHCDNQNGKKKPKQNVFGRFARAVEIEVGRPHSFVAAVAVVVLWGASGPFFGWSDTWQLVINTGTTIITFLMVFLIQYAQNRDTQALQLKLDELIRVTKEADDSLIDLENLDEEDLKELKRTFQRLARERGVPVQNLVEEQDATGGTAESPKR
jgi:low affinity Fe/Cu permease